jgi:hypothetical protein
MLESEVKSIVASDVAIAIRRLCSASRPCWRNKASTKGTMIMPPPMPSKPDKKPVQAPKSSKPATVSHGSARGRVEESALKMPC